jgi:SET domain-containing protein
MLRIKTYLDKSPVNGIGIFAGEDIPRGKIIWEFNPLVDFVYSGEEWDNLTKTISPESLQHVLKYAYKSKGRYYLCVDSAQFMNHNTDSHNIGNNPENNTMFARRNIKRGEELLCNYFEYCDSDDHNLSQIVSSV